MSSLSTLGIGTIWDSVRDSQVYQRQVAHLALRRVLRFTGWSIDDVINNPIAKAQVYIYYGITRSIEDRCGEINVSRQHSQGRVCL